MPLDLKVRNASPQDSQNLSDLIYFGAHVHRHLDWRSPLDWLGHEPFVILESGQSLLATLSCPVERSDLAWVRLFAYSVELDPQNTWNILFEHALNAFPTKSLPTIVALSLQNWFTHLLLNSDFQHLHNIVVLQWTGELPDKPIINSKYLLRPMTPGDLPSVKAVDHTAFERIWQISSWELQKAYEMSVYATVIQHEDQIIGYQISTANKKNAHLARLAIQKGYQGEHLGSALVFDLLSEFLTRNMDLVTVNTQHTNHKSLALYRSMNFLATNEEFPVLIYAP